MTNYDSDCNKRSNMKSMGKPVESRVLIWKMKSKRHEHPHQQRRRFLVNRVKNVVCKRFALILNWHLWKVATATSATTATTAATTATDLGRLLTERFARRAYWWLIAIARTSAPMKAKGWPGSGAGGTARRRQGAWRDSVCAPGVAARAKTSCGQPKPAEKKKIFTFSLASLFFIFCFLNLYLLYFCFYLYI